MKIYLIYLAAVNAVTFILFAADKYKAVHHRWRIREAVLLGFSAAGGAAGGFLAMLVCHHKTRKWYFDFLVPLFLILYIALTLYLRQRGILA